MNELQVFNNDEFGNIRVTIIDGKEMFVGKDVAKALGYSNPRDAISRHCKGVVKHDSFKEGGHCVALITEGDMYRLITHSKLPSAEEFEKWVFDEVLPTIRKTVKSLETIEYQGVMDDIVICKNGVATTTSKHIAKTFNKEHREILRAIDNKFKSKDENIVQFCTMNIKESTYLSENGQSYREYELTEEGFNFIALGLTGEKADVYKIKYIEAFSKMKKAIENMFKARVVESVFRNRQFVYIIENVDNGAIKIGVGNNPEKRLNQLQTGSVSELSLVYQSLVCSNAFNIESKCHKHFKDRHIRGEWYSVSKDEAINYLESQKFVLNSEFTKYISLIK